MDATEEHEEHEDPNQQLLLRLESLAARAVIAAEADVGLPGFPVAMAGIAASLGEASGFILGDLKPPNAKPLPLRAAN